jgi:hypothetical protein
VNKQIRWIIKFLALAHFTWGFSLIILAAWFAFSALRILPYMSSGNIWTNLPVSLTMASIHSFPLGALGTWIVLLGYRIWTGHAGLRKSLITTHLLLLVPGALSTAVGILTLRAGAGSAAAGGGLLSSIGMFPLAIGIGVLVLALSSIVFALTIGPKQRIQEGNSLR